jgi:electron-transferring-flavoprotein dehydrogenase
MSFECRRADAEDFSMSDTERESMEFDVVIVGAGPAGLASAIRLKQLNPELSVVVLEKGAEVGAHILSGAVVDPVGVDRLLPGWRDEADHPYRTAVTDDHFMILGPAGSIRLPNFLMPPLMNNHGNYIVSLGNVCRWLATHAEALGVEVYPGFAATELLYNDEGAVVGVATGDMGIERDGSKGPNYAPGMELLGPASSSTPSAGRWARPPVAAPSSIIWRTIRSRSVSWFT